MLQGINNCSLSTDQVVEGFLAAPPLISQTIEDLTVGHPNFLVDLLPTKPFPLGNGTQMQKIIFRGLMPEIERGFDKWAMMENPTGCDPCVGPGCGYHWSDLGGYGLERKNMTLMQRDYRTPDYCVNLIKYTYQFRDVMEQIMKNLWRQVSFIKAWNINHNALTSLSKKFVVDSGGPKINTANPYVYPNIGNARLSNLNVDLLEFFYNWMVLNPDAVPFGSQDGAPFYAVLASKQVLSRMWRDSPAIREDLRRCDETNCELVFKYNFMYSIRGMFVPAPILLPRRFNIVGGEPIEVLPYINGIPMEIGSYTGINPAYEAATHEEVLIMGRDPLSIFIGSEIESLGAGTSFGPQPNYLNWFKWVNPETTCDPFRRVGYFANHIEVGLQQDKSDGVFAVLVERPEVGLTFQVNPSPICPPTLTPCDNFIPPTSCPCPQVLGTVAIPTVPNKYLFTFAVPIAGIVPFAVDINLENGGSITGTVTALSPDGLSAEIVLNSEADLTCNKATFVGACFDTTSCSATVYAASDCRSGITGAVKLTLSDPIRAGVGDLITVYFGDGTTATLVILSADPGTNYYTVGYAPGFGPTDDPTGDCEVTTFGAPVLEFAEFFALMPGDNAGTVAVGAAVDFPQNGPAAGAIARAGVDTFTLPTIGTYRVLSQVSVDEPGQLVIKVNGTELGYTVVGRATGTSQIVVESLVTTTVINSVLSIVNPTGNAAALTITPIAGGTNAVSASLLIERLEPVSSSSVTVPCTTLNEGMICDRNGIAKVCVPPSTEPTCPACDPVAIEVCTED